MPDNVEKFPPALPVPFVPVPSAPAVDVLQTVVVPVGVGVTVFVLVICSISGFGVDVLMWYGSLENGLWEEYVIETVKKLRLSGSICPQLSFSVSRHFFWAAASFELEAMQL